MSLAHRVRRIVDEDGFVQLIRRSIRFGVHRGFKPLLKVYLKQVPPLPPLPVTYSVGGTTVRMYASTETELFTRLSDVREREVREDLLSSLRPGDVFYDVGANVGTYTCLVANKLSRGTIVAFEPDPSNVRSLKRNASRVSIEPTVYRIGLANEDDTIDLELVGDTEAGGGLHRLSTSPTARGDSIPVTVRKGDRFVREEKLPLPNVVKIDVEGAELEVIRGLRETISDENCRLVYCEIHRKDDAHDDWSSVEDYGGTAAQVEEELRHCGFEIDVISERDRDYHVKAYRSSSDRV